MMIASRNGFAVKRRYTAKDYVQDGLVAMWDGIENAGWGVHNPNATSWVDLVGNLPLTSSSFFTSNCEWTENSLINKSSSSSGQCLSVHPDIAHPWLKERGFFTTGTGEDYKYYLGTDYTLEMSLIPSFVPDNVIGFNLCAMSSGFCHTLCSPWQQPRLLFAPANGWGAYGAYAGYRFSEIKPLMVSGVAKVAGGSSLSVNGTTIVTSNAPCDRYYDNRYITTIAMTANSSIYNIRLYNRALIAAEIAANYAVDKARFGLP